jgi:hypothetical protein
VAVCLGVAGAATAGQVQPRHTIDIACKSGSSVQRVDCRSGYADCSLAPAAKVKAAHNGGESLSAVATGFAHAMFASSGAAAVKAGFTGCFAALNAEYDRLYR